MKKTKFALLQSVICLLLCMSMLIGTTFAWFTDSVTSGNNIIAAGNLDIELEYLDGDTWKKVNESTNVFKNDTLWEPGHTEVVYLKVSNAGTLALKYQLGINIAKEVGSVNQAGESFLLSDHIYFGAVEGVSQAYADRAAARAAVTVVDKLSAGYTKTGTMEKGAEPQYVALVVYMPEETGNAANYATGATPPSIDLGIALTATQMTAESDSFGSDYDSTAQFPTLSHPRSVTANVQVDATGCVAAAVSMTDSEGLVTAQIPAGVKLAAGVTQLTLRITEMETSGANLTLEENEIQRSLDVHIEGIAPDNTLPVEITIGKAMMMGLNIGNYTLYHVENGQSNAMTAVAAVSDLANHNDFYYDPATGDVTVYLATFSEVAAVANTENAWKGEFDYTWYTGAASNARDGSAQNPYLIANADQLAAFGAIVGGMNGQTRDSFAGKTVKLIADINLGDAEKENNPDIIFYPIGYNSSDGKYEKTGVAVTTGFYSFCGTFDGNGHTVSNFYQNTWEMKGDHDWYDATLQYYRDGMGLFGRVYGGTVKNLTVRNFKSDGEIATTGVIAAYADCGATFENIAIFNCNPRVYNIGNGGIVGCVGWYAKETVTTPVTFKNITVDNTNKISALWGSYDVACGGIVGQYYPTSGQSAANYPKNAGIHFENCHVSAQMDVYNDVCANYQYYAYRYSGMLIGSIRENVTIDGHVYPKMDGITAKDCTVHFGTWNDYYYCELVDNTTASYTHDYQMSRLTEIKAIDGTTITYLDGTTGTVPASGRANYVIVDYTKGHGTENATCYHFLNGKVWNHEDGGKETINGVEVLKEDKQHIYLEFNNLFTGYGWGVNSKGIEDYDKEAIKILDRVTADSVVKFEKANTASTIYGADNTVEIGELFVKKVNSGENLEINPATVQVTVSPVGETSTAGGTFKANISDWTKGTLTFTGAGKAVITITDYYYCIATSIEVTIIGKQMFDKKFDGSFLYRVGNEGTVELGTLFATVGNPVINNVSINITPISVAEVSTYGLARTTVQGNVSGEYNAGGTNWEKGTIQFSGTGVVKVEISADDSKTEVLYLEVVDAVNATGATSATGNNVVLLNDCGFSSLEVSGGYTLYGNGFTMTCGSDSAALDMGYSFVTLNNGTLDNVQIVCPNFDYAVLYKSNLDDMPADRKQTTDKTRYYNVKSGVMASGNSQILNSRISGGRAAVNVSGGNLLIDNSRIELGAVASLLVGAANSLTLRDVTLVQKPTASTYDSSKVLMGFSVLFVCDADGNTAPVTLEGTLVQNAWVSEDDKKYVPSAGQSIISTVLGKTEYLHDLDGDGTKESLNLGFAYMPESVASKVNATTITDNRTNNNNVPYGYADVSILNGETYVYSYKNTNGTADSFKNEAEYTPNKYGDIITVTYADTAEGLTPGKSLGADGWIYELNVDLDKLSGYKLDFSKLSMAINSTTVTDFEVNGAAKPTSPVAVTAGGVTYTLTVSIEGKEYTVNFKVTGTETSKESPSKISGPTTAGFGVAKSYGGDWSGAADVLTGVKVKYWSVAEKKYVEYDFSNFTVPGNAGKLNGTNSYWEYTHDSNDFTLKVTNTVAIHSGKSVYGMPIRGTDGKLYFTISSTNGYVGSGTTSRAITMQYEFTDNNGGEKLTFTHTFNISYNKDDQYSYSDLSGSGKLTKLEGSGGGGTCLAEGTLITLPDGSKKPIEQLRKGDYVMAFDHVTGKVTTNKVIIVVRTQSEFYKNTLIFDDGTELVTINEHGLFDINLNKYVNIDRENANEYIGHRFISIDTNGKVSTKRLKAVESVYENGYKYDIVTEGTLNYVAEDTLSVTHVLVDVINTFDFATALKYDQKKMAHDMEKYGLYTYDEWSAYCDISVFEEYNIPVMKVGISKELYTKEYIIGLINTYVLDESKQIIE